MKKTLLLVIIATLSTFVFVSCGKENVELANPAGSKGDPDGNTGEPTNPNNNIPKCFVTEVKNIENQEEYVTKFTYNAKNLLVSKDEDGYTTNYEYDGNSRITKMTMKGEGVETFMYEYDGKGNISKVKYVASEDVIVKLSVSEYQYTTNTKGQVEKLHIISEDGDADFLFEYDAKNNIKKVTAVAGTEKLVLLENYKFDDKINVYTNTNLAKAHLPHVIAGLFFGINMTYLCNTNNILSDSAISMFSGEAETSTYNYGYTAEGFPSKMTAMRTYDGETSKEEETYKYTCNK